MPPAQFSGWKDEELADFVWLRRAVIESGGDTWPEENKRLYLADADAAEAELKRRRQ
jgi:hypothetical protein